MIVYAGTQRCVLEILPLEWEIELALQAPAFAATWLLVQLQLIYSMQAFIDHSQICNIFGLHSSSILQTGHNADSCLRVLPCWVTLRVSSHILVAQPKHKRPQCPQERFARKLFCSACLDLLVRPASSRNLSNFPKGSKHIWHSGSLQFVLRSCNESTLKIPMELRVLSTWAASMPLPFFFSISWTANNGIIVID